MAQETLTLRTMNNGGIIEAVDAALAKIAENIADINTPPANPDGLELENIIVHVRAEDAVDVISVPFGGWKQRETFMSARAVVGA